MYQCIIIDDEPYAIEALKAYILLIPGLELVKSYTDPLVALKEISAGSKVDFLFMDIDMPHMSGIDLAAAIRDKIHRLVFSTSHKQYGYLAFEKGADAYLLKPYSLGKFAQTINKLLLAPMDKEPAEEYFFVKSFDDQLIKKIKFTDIHAVESQQNYVKIHLAQQCITTYMSLREISNLLEKRPGFIQLHRSFIIAQKHIGMIDGMLVEMASGLKFNVGPNFKKIFTDFVENKLISPPV